MGRDKGRLLRFLDVIYLDDNSVSVGSLLSGLPSSGCA